MNEEGILNTTTKHAVWKKAFVEAANIGETLPFTLFAGCSAFLNIIFIPKNPALAFWLGGLIGTITFLYLWKIPRIRAFSYLIAFSLFSYLAGASGVIEQFGALTAGNLSPT